MRDGRAVSVPGGKTSELLARLALDAGAFVPADRLIDELWDGTATRRNTLQSKVARLRRALGDPGIVASGDGGDKLRVDREAIDALFVPAGADAAAQRLAIGDHRGAVEMSEATLARFRGEVLAPSGEWADPYRASLEEIRMKLIEIQFSARQQLGHALTGELEAAVATYPYRETLWELLITALYGAGRQADALATYQRVRARLADDLGIEPGPRLRDLELQILNQDSGLPIAGLDAPVGNLPSLARELVGRDAEIAALSELVRTHRLIEIIGPGGIGKTALAIAVGRELAGIT